MDNVVIHGACDVHEDRVAEVSAAAPGFLAAVREEAGVVAYDLSWDILEPGRLHLLEHWESRDAYDEHTRQPHVAEWAALMKQTALAPLKSVKSRATPL